MTVRVFADSYVERSEEVVFYMQYRVVDGALDTAFAVDEVSENGGWVNVRVAEFPIGQVVSVLTSE
jgi:hypothetical protein